jgi:hypothetical protein
MTSHSEERLAKQLLTQFGPTIGGNDLYGALGFKTYSAFHRGHQRGEIKVNIFKLPGRRGWFALTNDLAAWLFSQAEGGRNDGLNQEKGRS